MPRYAWGRTDLVGHTTAWLLDITFAGQTIRIATDALTVPSDDGDLQYAGTLGDVVVTEGFDLFADTARGSQASMEVVFPVDVPALVASGHDLASATGELSQIRIGDDWEDRRVVLVGRLVDPSHGEAGEPVRFTLKAEVYGGGGVVPPRSARLTGEPWYSVAAGMDQTALLTDDDRGRVGPVIIGQPGLDPQYPDGWITGSRAWWLNKATLRHALVIACHRVDATEVWVNTADFVSGQRFAVTHGFNDAGLEIAYISDDDTASGEPKPRGLHTGLEEGVPFAVPAAFQPAVAEGSGFYVGWPFGAGLIGRNGQPIRGAGSVLEWALERTSLRVDYGRLAAVTPYLDRFKIDTAIEDFTAPMDWIQAHLLPLLPVSIADGPEGIYPILWRYDATAADAVGHIDADADPRIEFGRVEWDNSQLLNSFSLKYAMSSRTGSFAHTARVGPERVEEFGFPIGRAYGRTNDGDYITIQSETRGAAGVYTVNITEGGTTVTVSNRTITVEYDVGPPDTLDDIRDRINAAGVGIVADSDSAVSFGAAGYDTSTVLVYDDHSTMPDLYCRISRDRLKSDRDDGIREEETETEVVYDRETAYAVLGWRARAFALPHRLLTATLPESEWAWIDRGDLVTVTDSRRGLAAVLCFVQEVERGSDGLVGVRLRSIEDPLRDPRS